MSIDVQPQTRTPKRQPPSRETAPQPPRKQPKPGVKWSRLLLMVAGLAVLVAVALALTRVMAPGEKTKILTHPVRRGNLVVSVTEEGTLESSSNREIKCKVKGGSTVLWVIESGTEVKAGDELVRLDQSTIEDNISSQRILYENALANKTTTESDVAVAKIGVKEYLEGTFKSEMATKEKEYVIAESNLKSARNSLDHARKMFRKGYISRLELESEEDGVRHAELEVKVKQTDLEVLEKFTKEKQLQELHAALKAAEARLASDTAALELEKARLTREEQQLENCLIVADVAGMVIYPSAAEWKEQPDIEEGASVREDQVLLMIPELKKMQVKIGIHESKVDRLQPGMEARIKLHDNYVAGEVLSIASITKPTGWWNGNVVKYDTVIKLDEQGAGLKPGMSVAVEVFLARHEDVLTVPVAAIMEQDKSFVCWVETADSIVKRDLRLGDSNDQFVVVEAGLKEDERVLLNPIDFVDEAQAEALKPIDRADSANSRDKQPVDKTSSERESAAVGNKPQAVDKKGPAAADKAKSNPPKLTGAAMIKHSDKNGDGVLSEDEFDEKFRPYFESTDTDGNGKVNAAEMAAGLKRMQEAARQTK